jgi:hypothetical protein
LRRPATWGNRPEITHRRGHRAAASGRLAPAANVARLGSSVTADFNVKSQRFAEPQVIRIDARGLQRAEVEKISGPPASSLMKPKPRSAFHIFSFPAPILFPLRLQPELDQAADGFGAGLGPEAPATFPKSRASSESLPKPSQPLRQPSGCPLERQRPMPS